MPKLSRRRVLGGLAAAAPASLVASRVLGQASGPSSQAEIDLAKAKAEGQGLALHEPRHQIVDSVIGPLKDKYGIDVPYYRGGPNDVTSKVLAEADAGRLQVDMVDASDLAAILLMKAGGCSSPSDAASHRPWLPTHDVDRRLRPPIA